jgi:hypothetical protein
MKKTLLISILFLSAWIIHTFSTFQSLRSEVNVYDILVESFENNISVYETIVFLKNRLSTADNNVVQQYPSKALQAQTIHNQNKFEQYFYHGKNHISRYDYLVEDNIDQHFIKIETNEIYILYINEKFVSFNWSPNYGRILGSTRKFIKFPLINITDSLLNSSNNVITIKTNYSLDQPNQRNFMSVNIFDENNNVLLSDFVHVINSPDGSFLYSPLVIFGILAVFYVIFFWRKLKFYEE